jgi:hypothetical protein
MTVTCLYAWFLIALGVVIIGGVLSTQFLFFNQIIFSLFSIIFVSLVFFAKEI